MDFDNNRINATISEDGFSTLTTDDESGVSATTATVETDSLIEISTSDCVIDA